MRESIRSNISIYYQSRILITILSLSLICTARMRLIASAFDDSSLNKRYAYLIAEKKKRGKGGKGKNFLYISYFDTEENPSVIRTKALLLSDDRQGDRSNSYRFTSHFSSLVILTNIV